MMHFKLSDSSRAGLYLLASILLLVPLAFCAPPLRAQGTDAKFPAAPVIVGSDGMLYGTTMYGGKFGDGCVYAIATDGSQYRVVRSFGSSSTDGTTLESGLIQSTDGFLYGTTYGGGEFSSGTVFKIATDGTQYQVIRSLGDPNMDGTFPSGPVIEGSDGFLYGECYSGGEGGDGADGTVFKLARDGSSYQTLHSFRSHASDGWHPQLGLIEGIDGALYGVTQGQTNEPSTVFTIARDGSGFETIYAPAQVAPNPIDLNGIVQGSDGTLYGTSVNGGLYGSGMMYSIAADGSGFQALHSLPSKIAEATNPVCGMVIAGDGRLYGTCQSYGKQGNGSIWGVDTDGSDFMALKNFGPGASNEPGNPAATPCVGTDGLTLYGTAYDDALYNAGAVFKIKVDGTGYQVLHSFGN